MILDTRSNTFLVYINIVLGKYKPRGMLSTDCKNQSLRDRVDYKFDCRLQSSEFREPDFFCRLETTNCSVLNFSALRAATFIKKYMEIQKNIGRKVLKIFCAARGHVYLENN